MLTRVQISNINAIDYCDINFQKGKYKYLDNMVYQDKLVNPIAFYGSNGSGKSSFLKAILHLLRLMLFEPQKASPFTVNRLNVINQINKLQGTPEKPLTDEVINDSIDSITSFVKLFFEIDSDEYEYYIETALKGCITKEYLSVNSQRIFVRDIDSYQYNQP